MTHIHALKWMPVWAICIMLQWGCSTPVEKRAIKEGPVQVLFLGHDSEHHNSEAYLPMLQQALTPNGYYFTYEEDPSVLTEEELAKYDALVLYANHDEITDDQNEALMTFVESGGAFVPIHSASYCFRNSKDFVELVGGQFESHDTATFMAEIVNDEHPAMDEVTPFSSWDETYKHTKQSNDRTVLMERVEGEHREAYTWTREQGHGRVFYTALGHDERTWARPEFHQLIESGLYWALGSDRQSTFDQLDLPELEYSAAKIPNYEKRDPPPMLQAPFDPESSQKRIQVPTGFTLELFASEPDIFNPICMAWDEKGRLWLVETKDYPNEINTTSGIGNDRIKILEDTDGDGKADKFTVFAEDLSVPTSITFANGGVVVAQAPDFLFLKDTDGDDKADVRETIMTGWGTFDTHAGPSNLRYGFDNQIWGVVGYSAFDGEVGGEHHEFGQGVYRFPPDGSKLEIMGRTSNNTWGLGFTENFDVFISTANNTHSGYLGVAERHLKDVEGLLVRSVKKIDGHYAFHPNTSNFRQVDVFGGFTAAAGHSFYTARNYPKEYWNRVALVCEPTGHLLHRAVIEKEGAGFVEKDGWNLFASSDEWVSPVHAEVGPDGAVWILDWYNFIIQHNPTPPGFTNGPGNAHVNPLRDRQHGRIYRLVYDGASAVTYPTLSIDDPDACLAALKNDNLGWRLHAQRLLVERGNKDVKGQLLEMLQDESADEIGLNPGVVHALWTLHGLDLVNGGNEDVLVAVRECLSHPVAGVRQNAARVLPADRATLSAFQEHNAHMDGDAQVRLAVINKLTDMSSSPALADILYALSEESRVTNDEWLARALYGSTVQHKEAFIEAIAKSAPERIAEGYVDKDEVIEWFGTIDMSDWRDVPVPSQWSQTGVKPLEDNFDGIVWFKTTVELSGSQASSRATLHLGPISDSDWSYVNGIQVGSMENDYSSDRSYRIPAGVLKEGVNTITVKVEDPRGRGGLYGSDDMVNLQLSSETVGLAGTWKFKVESQFIDGRSVFNGDITVLEKFLQHYGPYAQEVAGDMVVNSFDQEIAIKTVPDQMRYDPEVLQVEAGSTVKIVFENNDGMQHNLLIGEPGSLEMIGQAADAMAQQTDGADRGYIPQLSVVLEAAGLIDPGMSKEMIWKVPDEPGTYIYVCTFPGHWRTMNGTIQVTKPSL